jgi:hypothetical protein
VSQFKRWGLVLFCTALALLCNRAAHAQISASTGAVQGRVTDPQSATIAGATVILTNTDTGTNAQATTLPDGTFVFALLAPGNYKIEVQAQGFEAAILNNILVEITRVTVANAKMQIGQVSTQVTVNEAALQVDTSTATTGDVMTGTQIRNIPLPTRNFLDLTTFQAGVSARIQSAATVGRGTPILDVAGSRATTNNFVLDGVDANNFGSGSLASVPVPNPDAIQEFRVSTSLYDASQGRGSGGNINVVMRSGTDQYHGGLFEFYRSNDFNANDFFFNALGKPRPVLLQNQYGGTAGGPVPKLKNTFWFFSYQGMGQKNGVSSAVAGVLPVLPARSSGESESTYAAALSTAFNVPLASIDPVAVNVLLQPGQYGGYLVGSGTGTVGTLANYAISLPTIYNEDQYSASIDHNLFRNNHVAVEFFYANITQFSPTGGGVSLGQGLNSPAKNYHGAITDTHTFNQNLVNEFRVGFTDIKSIGEGTENITTSDIGMAKWDASTYPGIPAFSPSGVLSFGGIGVNSFVHGGTNTTTIGDTLSWVRGKHTIRFGGEYRRAGWNYENDYGTRGSMSFPNFDSYLTGTPNRLQVDVGIFSRNFRANAGDTFVQDDYRITKKLMLNMGARWDFIGWPWDKNGKVSAFDPSLVTASCIANGGGNCVDAGFVSPAGTSFGTPGVSASAQETTRYHNFSPRLGFAYDPTGSGKMAIRGGYGIFYIETSGQTVLQPISSPPFVQQYLASGTGIVGSDVLANPWPAGLPLPSAFPVLPQIGQFKGNYSASGAPLFVTAAGTPAVSQSLYGFTRNLRIPYVEQWNLSVQYEFLKGWVAEIGYIGSHGIALLVEPSLNMAQLVNAANPGIDGLTVNSSANATIRAPILGFAPAGLNLVTNQGFSSYNAAILEVRHDFARSFQFRMDYTYSHSIDNDSGPTGSDLDSFVGNQLNPSFDRANSDFNQPHRIVFTYVWNLPGPRTGFLGKTIGGWGLSGVYTLQSGLPFTISSTSGLGLAGLTGSETIPAVVNGSCSGGYSPTGSVGNKLKDFVNASCFSPVPSIANGTVLPNLTASEGPGSQSYTVGGATASDTSGGSLFGYGARNIMRGPFEQRFDLALIKDIHFRERFDLQFRAEAFKLFNNVIFSNPSANISNYNANPALNAFGVISSTLDSTGRILQLGLKLNF